MICYLLKLKTCPFFQMFVQREVPELNHIFTFIESNKTTNIDFCTHLICLAQSSQNSKNSYVIFPGKIGFINISILQQGCLVGKHTVQIPYSYSFKITSLVAEVINQNNSKTNKLSKGVYIFIGFEDGTITMYLLLENGVGRPMVQIFKMRPKLKKKQPVINFKIIKSDLIVVCAYSAFIFKNIFEKQEGNASNNMKKIDKLKEQQINLIINSCKLDIQIDENNQSIYFYNQFEGAICLQIGGLTEVKKIQDSLKLIKVCNKLVPKQQNIAAFGSTDDAVKFINYNSNTVTKFIGLRNYPTCFEQDAKNGLLWVSCLDGSVACFEYLPKKQEKNNQFHIEVQRLRYRTQICQNGIKKIIIHNNVLIVLDTAHNIQFYDIAVATLSSSEQTSQQQKQQQSNSKNKINYK